jgi:predicted nuclease of predicted toxin-antitoxin system
MYHQRNIKFIADENIPLKVVERLKEENLDIKSIASVQPGLKDEEIARISEREKAVIITFDKDFGEIIFRKSLKPFGVILLRIPPKSIDYISEFLKWLLTESDVEFERKLVVVREDKIREVRIG